MKAKDPEAGRTPRLTLALVQRTKMKLTYLDTPEKSSKGRHQKKLTNFKGWHQEVPRKVPQKREHGESRSATTNCVDVPKYQDYDAITQKQCRS